MSVFNFISPRITMSPLASMTTLKFALAGLCLSVASGCASFKIKDSPPGFIQVSESDYSGEAELRMKAPDNVGLNITTFYNRRGGKLPLWSDDMVKKLGSRGYALDNQSAVTSANGVVGTRFDFSYQPPGSEDKKFYTAVLFVSDEWRVVVQLAGEAGKMKDHGEDLDRILKQIKIRGCKLGEDTCKGPQPPPLSTPVKAKIATDEGGGEDAKADEPADAKADEPADAKADAPAKADEPAPK